MSGVKSYKFDALMKGCDPNTPRQCRKCGKVLPVCHFGINGNGYYEHECLECKRARMKAYYKGIKEAGTDKYWEKRLTAIKQGALERKISCDITIKDLKDLFAKQKGCCYYTGQPMKSGSVDRIDPDRGYQADNIVMCERYINVFRGDLPISEFLKLCHQICRAHPEGKRGKELIEMEVSRAIKQIAQVEGVALNRDTTQALKAGFGMVIAEIRAAAGTGQKG